MLSVSFSGPQRVFSHVSLSGFAQATDPLTILRLTADLQKYDYLLLLSAKCRRDQSMNGAAQIDRLLPTTTNLGHQ
jgi:hypothetical protein